MKISRLLLRSLLLSLLHSLLRLSLFLTCTLLSAACFSQEIIRIYTIEEFDNDGKPLPLHKDTVSLLNIIGKYLPAKFDVRRVPWKRAMDNALQGDGILLGMSITTERAKKFAFSDPINMSRNWLITRCDAKFQFDTLADLKGKTLGVVLGTSAGEQFDQQANILFKLENDTGAGISRLQKLMAGRMDALVWYGSTDSVREMESIISRTFTANFPNQKNNLAVPLCVLPKPVSTVSNHFAMKLDSEKNHLLTRINLAMANARKEGDLPPANFSD
ncbi:MAG: transporter substrate-binding domain-containing protein [Pseudomonadota bacterium]